MASFVIFTIANSGESFSTKLALVRLFTGMGSHMNKKVSFLSKYFSTVRNGAFEKILA